MLRFENKVALVTGAGTGIGKAIATRLAGDGATLALIDIDEKKGLAVTEEFLENGMRASFIHTDISNASAVERTFQETASSLGSIDVLINNAAYTTSGNLESISLENWKREIEINLNGTYHCIRSAVSNMKVSGGGAIVNISSINALLYCGNPAYSAAKAAIINLTQAVATEYGKYGIRCNAVVPASVRTEAPTWSIRESRDPKIFERLARWFPLGRIGNPADIANAVSFLGSDDAGFITGIALPVDGGFSAGLNPLIHEMVLED